MNHAFKKILLLTTLLLCVVAYGSNFSKAYADVGYSLPSYQPLAPLPSNFFPNNNYQLGPYLEGMFRLLIALATVFAMIMIVWGGIEYMSTDAISGKEDGKEKIQNAIWGLILALVSWLILYTINPELLKFKFFAGSPVTQGTPTGNQPPGTSAPQASANPAPGSGIRP